MGATDRGDQAGDWASKCEEWAKRLATTEQTLEARISDLEEWAEKVSLRLKVMQRAAVTATAQLLMLQAGAAPDCNAALWEYFDQLGGDCDRLRQQIEMFKQLKSLSQTGGEA